MANNIDYNIRVGVIGNAEFQKFQKSVDGIAKSAKKSQTQLTSMGAGLNKMKGSIAGAATAFKGLAIAMVAREFTNTLTSFEDMRTTLKTIEGSAEGATAAFDNLNALVQNTPFQIEELTNSYIKLKAAGLDPTNEQMMLFSDVASVTTDKIGSLNAMTDLFSRTTAGGLGLEELNRLADRGIPVFDILSEKLGISRLEISEMGKSAEGAGELLAALSEGLTERFGGASEEALKNLSTAMSNFQGQVKVTIDQVVNSFGGTGGLAGLFQGMTALVSSLGNGFSSFAADIAPAVEGFKAIVANSEGLKIALAAIVAALALFAAPVSAVVAGIVLLIANYDDLKEATLSVIDYFKQLVDYVASLPGAFASFASDIVDGFVNGIKDYMSSKKDQLLKPFSDFATNVKGFFGIQSPSRMFMEVGGYITEGMAIGIEDGIVKPIEEMRKGAEKMRDGFASTLEGGLTNFFDAMLSGSKSGKDAFADMAKSMLKDMAMMIIKMKIIQPLMNALFPGMGGAGGATASARGNYFPDGITGKPLTAFASGGVIGGRSVIGSNLIGENGPEAVVPLRRHNGKMGVSASPVNINVVNNAGSEVKVSESTGNDGQRTIDIMIEQKVKNAFATGGMDKIMQSRFGSRPVGG